MNAQPGFEDAQRELEEIVQRLESGQASLDSVASRVSPIRPSIR